MAKERSVPTCSIRPIPELIGLLPKVRRQMRGDEMTGLDKDPLKLRRVDVPLHCREATIALLRLSNCDDGSELAPVIEQLDGAIVESDHALLLRTAEEAQSAACHIAIYGKEHEKKLSLLFYYAPAVEAVVPEWRGS